MMAWDVTADVERFDEAANWFLRRTVVTGDQARALNDRLKVESFWVGAGLQLHQIQSVFDKIQTAIDQGQTLADFKKATIAELRNDHHRETVFRNATQRAYNAGRWFQMHDPDVLRFRPFGLVDAILDNRTTPYCRDVDGTVLPLDHSWWLSHWFPAHHRCRTSVRNLTRSQAEKRGITFPPPTDSPQPGFGVAPALAQPWKPDPAKHDPALVVELDRKAQKRLGKRKPAVPAEHTADHWLPRYKQRYGDAAPALANGKASLERGLDLTPAKAVKLLEQLEFPGQDGSRRFRSTELMRTAVQQLAEGRDAKLTLRELGAELEPLAKAAAAVAGHLQALPKRGLIKLARRTLDIPLKRARAFFSKMSHPDVAQPTDWRFRKVRSRAGANAPTKSITYRIDVGVLEHEWGHALEDINPKAKKAAQAFLEARAKGEILEKLADILPGRGYHKSEQVWRDEFVHPYVGKRYKLPNGEFYGTEITSMAVEQLAAGIRSHTTLSKMMREDPEHVLLTLGILAGA